MNDNEPGKLISFVWWTDGAIAVGLAFFFGLVRYLQEFLGPDPPAFKWFIAIAKCFTAIAVGGLAMLVCNELRLSENWKWIVISLSGYGGAEVLNVAKEAGLDYLRRKAVAASEPDSKN